MGSLPIAELRALPFRRYETLTGVYDAVTGRLRRLPLLGFEAHAPWQPALLRLWNAANLKAAGPEAPVRIAMHPHDLSLPMARDLIAVLDMPLSCRCYHNLD
jgi:hypothetical protein